MKVRRYLRVPVDRALSARKMAFVAGPRQVGKTTFALTLLGPRATERSPGYFNWDDPRSAARIRRVELPPDAGAHTAFPLLGMTLTEFARQKLPANAPAPGGGHDHGEAVPLSSTQAHRDFIAVVSESLANECEEPRQLGQIGCTRGARARSGGRPGGCARQMGIGFRPRWGGGAALPGLHPVRVISPEMIGDRQRDHFPALVPRIATGAPLAT